MRQFGSYLPWGIEHGSVPRPSTRGLEAGPTHCFPAGASTTIHGAVFGAATLELGSVTTMMMERQLVSCSFIG